MVMMVLVNKIKSEIATEQEEELHQPRNAVLDIVEENAECWVSA